MIVGRLVLACLGLLALLAAVAAVGWGLVGLRWPEGRPVEWYVLAIVYGTLLGLVGDVCYSRATGKAIG